MPFLFHTSHLFLIKAHSKCQSFVTNARIATVNFKEENIRKVLQPLDSNKAHGFEEVSAHIIIMHDTALFKYFATVFKIWIKCCTFPDIWKKSNIYRFIRKTTKTWYATISLFPCYQYLLRLWETNFWIFLHIYNGWKLFIWSPIKFLVMILIVTKFYQFSMYMLPLMLFQILEPVESF